MNEVIMNSTRNLSEADVQAMAVYLKSLPPSKPESISKPSAETMQAGETLYNVQCGTCHLPTGLGNQDENSGARLAGSPVVQASNPASLINTIIYGPPLPNPPLPKRWKPMEGLGTNWRTTRLQPSQRSCAPPGVTMLLPSPPIRSPSNVRHARME